MDEFNALTQEMTAANKERRTLEHQLSDLMDKQAGSEDLLISLKESLSSTEIVAVLSKKKFERIFEN